MGGSHGLSFNIITTLADWLQYEPEPESDQDSDLDSEEEEEEENDLNEDDEYEETGTKGKRRSLGDSDRSGKRRKTGDNVRVTHLRFDSFDAFCKHPPRMSRDERARHSARLDKHYLAGTWYGQSASGTIYILATVLERVDNDFLWYAHFFPLWPLLDMCAGSLSWV